MRVKEKSVIGWREWVALPDLEIPAIKVKVDTGARSSALHARQIRYYTRRGCDYVAFDVNPRQRDSHTTIECHSKLHDIRRVTSSVGRTQLRPVIRTSLSIAGQAWEIDLTLTSRVDMGFRMLLGREAIRGRFVVDAGRSFLFGRMKKGKAKRE